MLLRKSIMLSLGTAMAIASTAVAIGADEATPTFGPGPSSTHAAPDTSPTLPGIPTGAQDRRMASAPQADAARRFAVLRRPRSANDALPHDARPGGTIGTLAPERARLATSGRLGQVFVVPTDREVCVSTTYANSATTGAADSCAPVAEAETYGAMTITQCSDVANHPQRRFFAGTVPDGVTAVTVTRDGVERARAAVEDNGFVLEVDDPVDTLMLEGSGTSRSLPPVVC